MALLVPLTWGLSLSTTWFVQLFGAISGSAVAATSVLVAFYAAEMKKKGYDPNFPVAGGNGGRRLPLHGWPTE